MVRVVKKTKKINRASNKKNRNMDKKKMALDLERKEFVEEILNEN